MGIKIEVTNRNVIITLRYIWLCCVFLKHMIVCGLFTNFVKKCTQMVAIFVDYYNNRGDSSNLKEDTYEENS